MIPRRLYWKAFLAPGDMMDSRNIERARIEVRNRIRDMIADEAIKIAVGTTVDGDTTLSSTLYVLTEEEMDKFIEHIQKKSYYFEPVTI